MVFRPWGQDTETGQFIVGTDAALDLATLGVSRLRSDGVMRLGVHWNWSMQGPPGTGATVPSSFDVAGVGTPDFDPDGGRGGWCDMTTTAGASDSISVSATPLGDTNIYLETVIETFNVDECIIAWGAVNGVPTASEDTEGAFFRADITLSAGNWFAYTQDADATRTKTDTGIPADQGEIHHLAIEKVRGASEYRFYIDGVLEATHTTNIPSAAQISNWEYDIVNTSTNAQTIRSAYFIGESDGPALT